MAEIPIEILSQLQCNECKEFITRSPIYLKGNKNVCGLCFEKSNFNSENIIRNKIFEETATLFTFPCKNVNRGCMLKLKWGESQEHEKHCKPENFVISTCPSLLDEKCSWQGTEGDVLEHFKKVHPEFVVPHPYKISPNLNWIIKEKKKLNKISLQNFVMPAHGYLFLLQFKICFQNNGMWIIVSFIGNPKLSENFEYFVEAYNTHTTLVGNLITVSKVEPKTPIFCMSKSVKFLLHDYFNISIHLNHVMCTNCNTTMIYRDQVKFCCANWNFIRNGKYSPKRILRRCLNYNIGCIHIDIPYNMRKHTDFLCKFIRNRKCSICYEYVERPLTVLDHMKNEHYCTRYSGDIKLSNVRTKIFEYIRGIMETTLGSFMCEWGVFWLHGIFIFHVIVISDIPSDEEKDINLKLSFVDCVSGSKVEKLLDKKFRGYCAMLMWQVEIPIDASSFSSGYLTFNIHLQLVETHDI